MLFDELLQADVLAAAGLHEPLAFDISFPQRDVALMNGRRQLLMLSAALVEPLRQLLLLCNRRFEARGRFGQLPCDGRAFVLQRRFELAPALVVASALGV